MSSNFSRDPGTGDESEARGALVEELELEDLRPGVQNLLDRNALGSQACLTRVRSLGGPYAADVTPLRRAP